MALDNKNKQITIEETQNIVGYKFENPSVVFKKPFAAMPNIIAKAKYIYPLIKLFYL
tara:strand:- start:132 stop:302 length:171 start_codon:yes stop_codon:yes gene_type:complete